MMFTSTLINISWHEIYWITFIDQVGCETQHWYLNVTNTSGFRTEGSVDPTNMSVNVASLQPKFKLKTLTAEYFALDGEVSCKCVKRM